MKQRTTSVAKALAVLASIGEARSRSLTEIAQAVRLPKSTLLRLISVLVAEGFVRRTAHGEYAVSLKLWRIGCNAVNSENVRDEVIPVLRGLVERTGETTHYCVYEAGYSVYIEKVDGSHPIRAYTSVGGRSPAYATATGKALLAWRDQAEIEEVARQSQRWTDKTLVGIKAILRHADEIRKTGYAVNRGEWRESVWGIAAPVFDRYGKVIAAVGISGPRDRVEPNVDEFAVHVRDAAAEVSRRHGALERAS